MLKPSVYLLLSAALFTAGCQPKEAATPATASAASAATAAFCANGFHTCPVYHP